MGPFIEDTILFFIFMYIIRKVLSIGMMYLSGKKPGQSFNQAGRQAAPETGRRKPEGSIEIKFAPDKKKGSSPDNAGDFIDYEEIKTK